MTFDDQLRRAFDTLTDRLQADIRRQVQAAIDEIAAAHAVRESTLARDLDAAKGKAAAELEEARRTAARDVTAAREALARDVDAAVAASVLREAEAVKKARADARDEALREADAVHRETQHALGAAAAARLLDAIRSVGRARSLGETLDTLVSCAAREAERAAVLTVRSGVLHGWRFIGFGALDANPSAGEGVNDRGLADRALRSRAVAQGDGACAIPLALAGDVVAVLYATQANVTTLEILSRHAARSLEAMVAFKAARAISVPSTSVPAGTSVPSASDRAADRESDDVAARRYARLLVSEIRLYHEPEVVAGRRDRDLAVRLGGEIARARALYDQRVPPHVRNHSPYFDEELVRTLADGDASLLEVRT